MSRRAAGGTILVVGDVIDDIVVRPLVAPVPDADTPSAITACPGGSAANQAAWLGSLGAAVRFAGRVGAGDVARHTAALRAFGVDARLAADPSAPTGQIVVIAVDGRRDMYTSRGANLNLTVADLPDDLLDDVALLHVTGYSLFHPRPRAAVAGLMTRARDRGIPISADPSSATYLTSPSGFVTDTHEATLLFPNLAEARLLARATRACETADDPAEARETADDMAEAYALADALVRTYEVVALKLGPAGALLATADGVRLHHRAPTTKLTDPTGAGDAFCAAFLASWTSAGDLPTCLHKAQQCAATALTTPGARPCAQPTR